MSCCVGAVGEHGRRIETEAALGAFEVMGSVRIVRIKRQNGAGTLPDGYPIVYRQRFVRFIKQTIHPPLHPFAWHSAA